jgi:hypothetical protein
LEQELKAARVEMGILTAGNDSNSIKEKVNFENWIKPKNSISKSHRFSADDAAKINLSNRFSVLEADTLETGWQSPVLLKHDVKEKKSFPVNSECKKKKLLLLGSSYSRGTGPML